MVSAPTWDSSTPFPTAKGTHLNVVLGDEGNVGLMLQKSVQPEVSGSTEKTRAAMQTHSGHRGTEDERGWESNPAFTLCLGVHPHWASEPLRVSPFGEFSPYSDLLESRMGNQSRAEGTTERSPPRERAPPGGRDRQPPHNLGFPGKGLGTQSEDHLPVPNLVSRGKDSKKNGVRISNRRTLYSGQQFFLG